MTDPPLGIRVAVVCEDWSDPDVSIPAPLLVDGFTQIGAPLELWTPGGRGRGKPPDGPGVHLLASSWWRKWGRADWQKGAARRLAAFGPDLVLTTSWRPLLGVMDAIEGLGTRRPAVAVLAGRDVTTDVEPAVLVERRAAFSTSARWLVHEERVARALQRGGVREEQIFEVPRAVDGPEQPPERGLRHRPRRLLTVAPLVPSAGQDKMIEALALLGETLPHLKYEIVGDGPDEARLKALAQTQGVADRTVFRGALEGATLEHAYARADLFVLLARRGRRDHTPPDFAGAVLAAGARRLAVFGSGDDAGGGIEDGATGTVVAAPRDARAVADALENVLKLPLGLATMGRAGRRRFEAEGKPSNLARHVMELGRIWAPT